MPRGPMSNFRDGIRDGMPKAERTAVGRLAHLAKRWQNAKNALRQVKEEEERLRKEINSNLEIAEEQYTDSKGNQWVELGEEVVGYDTKGNAKSFNALQRQRRVSVFLDQDAALEVAKRHRLTKQVAHKVINVVDPDQVIRVIEKMGLTPEVMGLEIALEVDSEAMELAYFEGKYTKEEFDQVFEQKVTWALYATRA